MVVTSPVATNTVSSAPPSNVMTAAGSNPAPVTRSVVGGSPMAATAGSSPATTRASGTVAYFDDFDDFDSAASASARSAIGATGRVTGEISTTADGRNTPVVPIPQMAALVPSFSTSSAVTMNGPSSNHPAAWLFVTIIVPAG